MKKILIYTVSLFVTAGSLVAQPEKEINAEMKHVTVFPDRAQISHEANVNIAQGKRHLNSLRCRRTSTRRGYR